jgi:flagellar basal body-associated protein FliL
MFKIVTLLVVLSVLAVGLITYFKWLFNRRGSKDDTK